LRAGVDSSDETTGEASDEIESRGVRDGAVVLGIAGVGNSSALSGVDDGGTITTRGAAGVGVTTATAGDVSFGGGRARRTAVEMRMTASAPPTAASPTIVLIGIFCGNTPVLGALASSFKTTWRGKLGAPPTVDGPDGSALPVLDVGGNGCGGKGCVWRGAFGSCNKSSSNGVRLGTVF